MSSLVVSSRIKLGFEQALNRFDGAVLAVVHDRFFIRLIADEIWWVENGGIRRVWEISEGNANPRGVDRSVHLAGRDA